MPSMISGGLPTTSVDTMDMEGNLLPPSQSWRQFLQSVLTICNALTTSGTTAQRPTTLMWPGRMYFDTSLAANGRPIWVNKLGTGWVDSAGGAV